jgi:tRNA (guanine-N7-)-methyltransferase
MIMPESSENLRNIRSFVRRNGRITAAQQRALDTLWSQYVIEPQENLDLNQLFERDAQKYLEIGFGRGESLLAMAHRHPEHDYLGIEVHLPGVGHILNEAAKLGLTNVRVICVDAVEVLEKYFLDNSLDCTYIFFPDPWHKARHHKRRLIQEPFLALLARRIKPDGYLKLATDWEDYAQQMLQLLERTTEFVNCVAPGNFAPRCEERPLTKFERRGQRLGHSVWDLCYQRVID